MGFAVEDGGETHVFGDSEGVGILSDYAVVGIVHPVIEPVRRVVETRNGHLLACVVCACAFNDTTLDRVGFQGYREACGSRGEFVDGDGLFHTGEAGELVAVIADGVVSV